MQFFPTKKPKGLSKDILENKTKPEVNLREAKKLLDMKTKKSDIEFLIDENILGIDRHLKSLNIPFRKIGDPECPKLGSDDPIVAKFAQENNLVIVTNDDNLLKQCDLLEIDCVMQDLRDLAKKVKAYSESH